jgi:RNA recognition motif-containing protein
MRDAGDVQYSKVLTDRDGRSKGCGIVEFSTVEGAKDAIEKLTDTELKGRKIFVREDREDGKPRGGGGGGRSSPSKGKKEDGAADKATPAAEGEDSTPKEEKNTTQLFIGNLSWETTWQELKDHFKTCGDVEFAEVATGRDGRSKGFGFIKYGSAKEATEAMEKLNGVEFMGRALEVRLDAKA